MAAVSRRGEHSIKQHGTCLRLKKAVNGHVSLASNTCHHVLGLILIRIGTNEHCTTVLFNARKE